MGVFVFGSTRTCQCVKTHSTVARFSYSNYARVTHGVTLKCRMVGCEVLRADKLIGRCQSPVRCVRESLVTDRVDGGEAPWGSRCLPPTAHNPPQAAVSVIQCSSTTPGSRLKCPRLASCRYRLTDTK